MRSVQADNALCTYSAGLVVIIFHIDEVIFQKTEYI